MLTHRSAFIYNHLINSLVLFILDTFGRIVEVNTKKLCYSQQDSGICVDWNFVEEKTGLGLC